jgi:hypothetical protein
LAVFALTVLAFGLRFSISFASEASVEAAPVTPLPDFPAPPQDDDRPITVRVEYSIADGNRQRFSDFDAGRSSCPQEEWRIPLLARRVAGIYCIHLG